MDVHVRSREVVARLTEREEELRFTRSVFLRSLAVISFLAFLSLHVQLLGLVGSEGILPARQFLSAVAANGGGFLQVPTLAWLSASDAALQFLTVGGMLLSVLLFVNVAPRPVLFLLWLFYLSLTSVGQVFLSYQWDALLLETLFLSIFLAPSHLDPRRRGKAPTRFSVWMLRVVLFKLMFLGGLVKLLSGDPVWRNLTALTYHYETQPLPNPLSWYAHHLPPLVHKVSALGMFGVELLVPLLIFFPRTWRIRAAAPMLLLQLAIIATGNYGAFNLLAIALLILLLDDRLLEPVQERLPDVDLAQARTALSHRGGETAVLTVMLLLNVLVVANMVGVPLGPADGVQEAVAPFRTVNTYGLFADMTTTRPELVVQGSRDGETWKSYEFRYKVDDPSEAPPVVAPHMPRLDWQFWFAAYRSPRGSRWLLPFTQRLLQGSEPVGNLLAENPFPEYPPRYVRILRYRYEFSEPATKQRTGRWWSVSGRETYLPPVTLEDGQLMRARAR
ncbi:MAG: lipase maturation factor family protein [Candidatus Nanohaloarchaea archaeon]|nr:lipase maturation factor family protein [Candidatus Nanohaloarchaea archaeon]